MAGQKYDAKEKRVQKMSRDGLVEINLSDDSKKKISQRPEDILSIRSSEYHVEKKVGGMQEQEKRKEEKIKKDKIYKEKIENSRKKENELTNREVHSFGKSDIRQEFLQHKINKEIKENKEEERSHIQENKLVGQGYLSNQNQDDMEEKAKYSNLFDSIRVKKTTENSLQSETSEGFKDSEERRIQKKKLVQSYIGKKEKKEGEKLTAREKVREVQREWQRSQNCQLQEDKNFSKIEEKERMNDQSLEDFREEIERKRKREQLLREQRKQGKKTTKLSFDEGQDSMVKGAGIGVRKRNTLFATNMANIATKAVSSYVHGKIHESEKDNTGVEAVHKGQLFSVTTIKRISMDKIRRRKNARYFGHFNQDKKREAKKNQLNFGTAEGEKIFKGDTSSLDEKITDDIEAVMSGMSSEAVKPSKKQMLKHFWQKRQYKEAYLATKNRKKAGEKATKAVESIAVKAKKVIGELFSKKSHIVLVIGLLFLLFGLISISISSCTALLQGSEAMIVSSTYMSTDEEIYKIEEAYVALEEALNEQINSIKTRQSGYDEYRYQIDEISHNPYQLVSYFTAKYGNFTYRQVAAELKEIFKEQYQISTEEQKEIVPEVKKVHVGESLGNVVTSGYCRCSVCNGEWTGYPTASGVYPTQGHTIAVDANNPIVPIGTTVILNGTEYVVEDTGDFSQYGVQFDIYYESHEEALRHGHQSFDAYLVDENGNREIEVIKNHEVSWLNVTLKNYGLNNVLEAKLDLEEKERYKLYNATYGNRTYLFDLDSITSYGSREFSYTVPEAELENRKFVNMIKEAEKYLGTAYVWGGNSPETGFDCSGFISWVINHCGNDWNVGRVTAEELRGHCQEIKKEDAKAGDFIFFQGTYDTEGASHVGIYVGNGVMLHCGNPIQYTSIESNYWKQHFLSFGRLS